MFKCIRRIAVSKPEDMGNWTYRERVLVYTSDRNLYKIDWTYDLQLQPRIRPKE
jgi:hypothetical protein